MREVRDWALLRRFCREAGIAHPVTLLRGEEGRAGRGRWLRKRLRSGGGHGDRTRGMAAALDDAHLLQAEVDGRAASVAFVADGRRGSCLRSHRAARRALRSGRLRLRLVRQPAAARASRAPPATSVRAQIEHMVSHLTRRFGLVGVNGLDVVIGRDPEGVARPYLIEVNPRFSGSMELAERAFGVNVFSLHLEGSRRPPAASSAAEPRSRRLRRQGDRLRPAPDRRPRHGCVAARGVRDVPWPGQRIAAGHPVCTVLARGRDRRGVPRRALLGCGRGVRRQRADREGRRERTTHLDHRTHA